MIATINTVDYLQSLSLAELKSWCADTTPIVMTWADDTEHPSDEDGVELSNLEEEMLLNDVPVIAELW